MAETFRPGDVVRLKSGGPKMTVENAGEDAMTGQPFVTCVWFEKTAAKRHQFSPDALELAGEGRSTFA